VLTVRGLTKSFGNRPVLAGIDLDAQPGEALALVGPNGAGKTTLLRILATLTRPSGGQVSLDGADIFRAGAAFRRQVGFVSHQTLLYGDLTAERNLSLAADLFDVSDCAGRVAEVLDLVGLSGRRDEPVNRLSRGMQQRLALGRALLHEPDILLLDEPYTGLDRAAAQTTDGLLRHAIERGCLVMLATHDLERGARAADRVILLHRGRKVYDGVDWANLSADLGVVYDQFTGLGN